MTTIGRDTFSPSPLAPNLFPLHPLTNNTHASIGVASDCRIPPRLGINGIRSSSVRIYGGVVKCQSHERHATENRPGYFILRNLVARLPEFCLIARILSDSWNFAWLPNLCIGSYVNFAMLPEFCHVARILPRCRNFAWLPNLHQKTKSCVSICPIPSTEQYN